MMATVSSGKVTIYLGNIDLTPYFTGERIRDAVTQAVRDMADRYLEDAMSERPPLRLRFPVFVLEMPITRQQHLTILGVRSAAPIRACLWRRNLDGGNWRKRGHAAHRK